MGNRICVGAELTQLIKVGVAAVGPRNRADQPGLQERRPFVYQTSLAAHVILIENKKSRGLNPAGSRVCAKAGFRQSGIGHPAELADARVGGLPQPLGLHRRLAEEEKHLVVIRVFAFRDPERADKLWFWRGQEVVQGQTSAGTVTLRMTVYTTSHTDRSASASRAARCEWTAVSPCS